MKRTKLDGSRYFLIAIKSILNRSENRKREFSIRCIYDTAPSILLWRRKMTWFWNFCGATCTLELDRTPVTRRYKVFAFIIKAISTWNRSIKGCRRALLFVDAFETSWTLGKFLKDDSNTRRWEENHEETKWSIKGEIIELPEEYMAF